MAPGDVAIEYFELGEKIVDATGVERLSSDALEAGEAQTGGKEERRQAVSARSGVGREAGVTPPS